MGKTEMEYFVPIVLLSLTTLSSGQSRQDEYVLENTYYQMWEFKGFTDNFWISPELEELAQEHSCVRRHSDHWSTDREALSIYNNYGAIIACVGGCEESESNWSREKPASIWYEFRFETSHYRLIMENNLAGCSAAMDWNEWNGVNEWCVFCYLASADVSSVRTGLSFDNATIPELPKGAVIVPKEDSLRIPYIEEA